MKIAVRYYSKTGNTKKLANAIATQLHVDAKDISEGLNEKVDILFLGSPVYWAGMDGSVKKFKSSTSRRVSLWQNMHLAARKARTKGHRPRKKEKIFLHF